MLFNKIEGSVAITRFGGVYKQTEAYERNGLVYVKYGSGYVRVYQTYGKNGYYNTTKDKLIVDFLDVGTAKLSKTELGQIKVDV